MINNMTPSEQLIKDMSNENLSLRKRNKLIFLFLLLDYNDDEDTIMEFLNLVAPNIDTYHKSFIATIKVSLRSKSSPRLQQWLKEYIK